MKVYALLMISLMFLGKLSGQEYFEKRYPISKDSQLVFIHTIKINSKEIFIDYELMSYWYPSKHIGIIDSNLNVENKCYIKSNYTDNDLAFGKTNTNVFIGSVRKNEGGGPQYDSSEVVFFSKANQTITKKRVRDKPGQSGGNQTITLRVFDNRVYTISQAQMTNVPGGYHDSLWRMTISDTNLNPIRIVELKLDKQLVGNDFVKVGDKFYLIGTYTNFYTNFPGDSRNYVEIFKFNSAWEIIGQKRFYFQDPGDRGQNRIIKTRDNGLFIYTTLTSDSLAPSFDHMETSYIKLDTNFNLLWTYKIKCGTCLFAPKIFEDDNGDFFACGYKYLQGFILKLDKNGNKQWEHTYHPDLGSGNVYFSSIQGVHELAGGNLIAIGKLSETIDTLIVDYLWMLKLDRNGCTGYDCGDEVFLESKNIQMEQSAGSLQVYPNPGKDQIEIALSEVQRSGFPESYKIFDANGKMILSEPGNQAAHQYLDTRRLSPGVYFITATFRDHTQQSTKWIKEND